MNDTGVQGQIDVRRILQAKAPNLAKRLPTFVMNYLIRITNQNEVNDILRRFHDKDGANFMTALLDYFGIRLQITDAEQLPPAGRYIFASNHPLGGLDGICLSAVLGQRFQGRIRYLVNDLLLFIPNLRSIFVPINKHGRQSKVVARLTDAAYASNNQIITFPAGLCSRKVNGQIVDLEWKKSFIRKAIAYHRDVVPVFFEGNNSASFYRLANLRKRLRLKTNLEMLFLPNELFRSSHATFRIFFGRPIPWQTFDNSRNLAEWSDWVRDIVYRLAY